MGRYRGRVESGAEPKRAAVVELFHLGLTPSEIASAGKLRRTTVDRALRGLGRPGSDAPFSVQFKRLALLWTDTASVSDPRAARIVKAALHAHLGMENTINMLKGAILRDPDGGPDEGSAERAGNEALRVVDLCLRQIAKGVVPIPQNSTELILHLVRQRDWSQRLAHRSASR